MKANKSGVSFLDDASLGFAMLTEKADTGTFKCPECGTKVLKATGRCLKCKKRVKQEGVIVALEYFEGLSRSGKSAVSLLDIPDSVMYEDVLVLVNEGWVDEDEQEKQIWFPGLCDEIDAFNAFATLVEGVYDPGIFKAIFLAGGPASGKSFTADRTTGGHGFKIINSDAPFEIAMNKAGLSLKMPKDEEDARNMIRSRAKAVTSKRMDLFIDGRLGLVIDGTGHDFDRIKRQSDGLRELGYDTMMIFVNTSLDTALERNRKRARTVPEDIVKKSWEVVQNNMGKFQSYFGNNNFFLVDANNPTKEDFDLIWRRVAKLSRRPPENRAAKAWVKAELDAKKRE